MRDDRVTVRMPKKHIEEIDSLVRKGKFSSRSEVIREAVKSFVTH
ncbi:MAG: ribbon-helix-helix domain-containing protein [Candidatus Hydrothermarchaeota archaeon]